METPPTNTTHIPEALVTEILARLPLRTIWRFKSVCKTWKSILDSVHFRRLFLSIQGNSTCSWSLMFGAKELLGFHGDLPKSPGSFIPPSFKRVSDSGMNFNYKASSNGLILIDGGPERDCYVGNPVLQQWFKIPSPPNNTKSTVFGLVTRVDEDGVVLSFKVIRLASYDVVTNDHLSSNLSVFIFSSETGLWSYKPTIYCPYQITNFHYINLNGTVYLPHLSEPQVLVSLDFYSEPYQFRVVHFPDYPSLDNPYQDFSRASLTTSGGFLMYMKTLDSVFKAWKLINDSTDNHDTWQLLWEIRLPDNDYYVPMAMHPFDTDTVYLWSQFNRRFVSFSLRRQSYTILLNDKDCFMDQSIFENKGYGFSLLLIQFMLSQFVLPRWMESLPRPPQAEMIDTTELLDSTSLVSCLASRNRNRGWII